MKKNFYATCNPQLNGQHEVHDEHCPYLPQPAGRTYLGAFSNCRDAVSMAKLSYAQANGCKTCAPACHTHPTLKSIQ